jgi:hypothetical protein
LTKSQDAFVLQNEPNEWSHDQNVSQFRLFENSL